MMSRLARDYVGVRRSRQTQRQSQGDSRLGAEIQLRGIHDGADRCGEAFFDKGMNIVIIATHLSPTEGWGTETLTSVRGLRALGHRVETLVQTKYDGDACPQYAALPEPLALLRSPVALWKTAKAIRRQIAKQKPDIVHIMTEPYALALALVGRTPPLCLTANGTYALLPLASRLPAPLMRRAYRRAAHIFAISRYTERRLTEELERRDRHLAEHVQTKISAWTLGVEWPSGLPARQARKEKNILFVGSVKPRKGVREVVEACAAFRRISSLPFHLHIIGSAPENRYTNSLRSRIGELRLTEQVTIHGQVADAVLQQAYADADLFMMLSISEGFHFEGYGLVFLEANIRGVPGIGPREAGCADAISEGRSGYLVDPKDPAMVAERMKWVLEKERIDPEQCKQWVREHSIERQARELENAYARIL
jgi:glycosyltransferase involved in cell wall biosynthesis